MLAARNSRCSPAPDCLVMVGIDDPYRRSDLLQVVICPVRLGLPHLRVIWGRGKPLYSLGVGDIAFAILFRRERCSR